MHQGGRSIVHHRTDVVVAGDGPVEGLGLEVGDQGVVVDRNGRSSLDGVYAGGWMTRGKKVQAAIWVGNGAAMALDILS